MQVYQCLEDSLMEWKPVCLFEQNNTSALQILEENDSQWNGKNEKTETFRFVIQIMKPYRLCKMLHILVNPLIKHVCFLILKPPINSGHERRIITSSRRQQNHLLTRLIFQHEEERSTRWPRLPTAPWTWCRHMLRYYADTVTRPWYTVTPCHFLSFCVVLP